MCTKTRAEKHSSSSSNKNGCCSSSSIAVRPPQGVYSIFIRACIVVQQFSLCRLQVSSWRVAAVPSETKAEYQCKYHISPVDTSSWTVYSLRSYLYLLHRARHCDTENVGVKERERKKSSDFAKFFRAACAFPAETRGRWYPFCYNVYPFLLEQDCNFPNHN